MQELYLTLYIDSKYELPYIDLTRRNFWLSYHSMARGKLSVRNDFSAKQKKIQHLNMLTHNEYMKKLTIISISSFHLVESSSTIPVTFYLVLFETLTIIITSSKIHTENPA